MKRTFADMEKEEAPSLVDLKDSLADYADGGWGIAARGLTIQTRRKEVEAAREYKKLLNYLAR
jgi:hypothetical protein